MGMGRLAEQCECACRYDCTFSHLFCIFITWHEVQSKLTFAWRGPACRNDMQNMGSLDYERQVVFVFADYMNDTYSRNDSCNAICCRGDLRRSPVANGCYDAKVCLCVSLSVCLSVCVKLYFFRH